MKESSYIFGLRPCMEALEAGANLERIWIRKGLQGELYREVFEWVRKSRVPYQFVPVEKLNRITGKNHQGMIALTALVTYQPVEELITRVFESGGDPLIVALDGVTDVRNFGAIARSAEGAGVHALLVPEKGGAQINADAMKTSAGTLNVIPVCRTPDLAGTVRWMKESGLRVIGASEQTVEVYHQTDLTGPMVLVMGAEDQGISAPVRTLCDAMISIPMVGKVSSLNVSVAAGILLFEILRQRTI